MGALGGNLGIQLLNYASKNGTVSSFPDVATAYEKKSKLEVLFGPGIWDEIVGKDVLDFGCGQGTEAVEVAERGAKSVTTACVHPILSDRAAEKICSSEIQELVVTDTIPLPPHKRHEKITVLSVAPMLGEAITRIHTGQSVGALFQ